MFLSCVTQGNLRFKMFHPSPNHESAVDQKLMEKTAVAQRSPVNPCAWLRLSWLPKWRHPVANCPWSSAKMADNNYRQFEYWSLNCQGVTFRPCHIILTPAVEEGCNKSKSEIYSAWSISSIDRVEPKIVPFSWGRYHRHFPMDKCGRWWCSGRTWPWFPHRFLSNIFAKWDLSHALFWNEFAIRLWFHCLVQKKYSCCPVHNWKKRVLYCSHSRVFLLHNLPRSL